MSKVLNSLSSRGGLFKTVFAVAALAVSVAAHAAGSVEPATPSVAGDTTVQAHAFEMLAGLTSQPLSASETNSFDGERAIRLGRPWRPSFPHRKPLPIRCLALICAIDRPGR